MVTEEPFPSPGRVPAAQARLNLTLQAGFCLSDS